MSVKCFRCGKEVPEIGEPTGKEKLLVACCAGCNTLTDPAIKDCVFASNPVGGIKNGENTGEIVWTRVNEKAVERLTRDGKTAIETAKDSAKNAG